MQDTTPLMLAEFLLGGILAWFALCVALPALAVCLMELFLRLAPRNPAHSPTPTPPPSADRRA